MWFAEIQTQCKCEEDIKKQRAQEFPWLLEPCVSTGGHMNEYLVPSTASSVFPMAWEGGRDDRIPTL